MSELTLLQRRNQLATLANPGRSRAALQQREFCERVLEFVDSPHGASVEDLWGLLINDALSHGHPPPAGMTMALQGALVGRSERVWELMSFLSPYPTPPRRIPATPEEDLPSAFNLKVVPISTPAFTTIPGPVPSVVLTSGMVRKGLATTVFTRAFADILLRNDLRDQSVGLTRAETDSFIESHDPTNQHRATQKMLRKRAVDPRRQDDFEIVARKTAGVLQHNIQADLLAAHFLERMNLNALDAMKKLIRAVGEHPLPGRRTNEAADDLRIKNLETHFGDRS